MDLGRGTHCAFAFEGVVTFGLQEVPAERVNGPQTGTSVVRGLWSACPLR